MQKEKDRLLLAQWVFERQLAWVSAAEIKIGVVVTINIAMIASVASLLGTGEVTKHGWCYFLH